MRKVLILKEFMARLERLELPTHCLEGSCSYKQKENMLQYSWLSCAGWREFPPIWFPSLPPFADNSRHICSSDTWIDIHCWVEYLL